MRGHSQTAFGIGGEEGSFLRHKPGGKSQTPDIQIPKKSPMTRGPRGAPELEFFVFRFLAFGYWRL
jgi:hypothetical protein